MTTPEPVYTHVTPSGVKVYIVLQSERQAGWMLMSNGAIIDDTILAKWHKIESETK